MIMISAFNASDTQYCTLHLSRQVNAQDPVVC